MQGTGVNLNFEVCPLAEVYIASFPLVSSPDPTYERVGSGDETTFPPAFARVLIANFIPQAGLITISLPAACKRRKRAKTGNGVKCSLRFPLGEG